MRWICEVWRGTVFAQTGKEVVGQRTQIVESGRLGTEQFACFHFFGECGRDSHSQRC